jgi:general secretion pathway protein G
MKRRKNRRKNQRGLTLVELVVAFTIMLILSSMAVPLARSRVRAARQRELANDLREMRSAIDKYKDYADLGYLGPQKQGTNNWPETLDILVEGVKLPGPDGKKMRFLRRVPVDPFTGKAEWGMRSDQDDPKSLSWGGQDVFDVYSKTTEKAADGKPYSEW